MNYKAENINIHRISTIDEFKALEKDWNSVLEKSSARSVFLAWEWMYQWWLHFSREKELYILVAKRKDSEEIVGIAPFCKERVSIAPLFMVRKIKFLGTEHVGSDFLEFIITAGCELETVFEFYGYLAKHECEWDVIELSDMDRDSPAIHMIKNMNNRYRIAENATSICPYIKLPETYKEYMQSLTPVTRKELRKKTRKLEEDFDIDFKILGNKTEILDNIDDIFKLHDDGFRLKEYDSDESAFTNNRVREFHYDVVASLLENKRLKVYFITHKGKPIACSYAFHFKNRFFAYQTGFDSNWHKWSLGTILIGYCIEWSINNRLDEFHFLRGSEEYKSRWAKTSAALVRVSLANRTFKGLLYSIYINCKNALKALVYTEKKEAASAAL